jgi:hypothetical protein
LQCEHGAPDQPGCAKPRGERRTVCERGLDRFVRERADLDRDQPLAEVGGVVDVTRAAPLNQWACDVDCVRDHRRRRIRRRAARREHGDAVGDPEAPAASAPAARRHAAHRHRRIDFERAVERQAMAVPGGAIRIGDEADAQAFARGEMQRDVAAVVDVGLGHAGAHGVDDLVGHRAGHRRHRRDESLAEWPAGGAHSTRNGAGESGRLLHRPSERRQLGDELLEDGLEPAPAALDGRDRTAAERLDDEVDGPVLEMPPALVQARANRTCSRPCRDG